MFIKHVLPRFTSPDTPNIVIGVAFKTGFSVGFDLLLLDEKVVDFGKDCKSFNFISGFFCKSLGHMTTFFSINPVSSNNSGELSKKLTGLKFSHMIQPLIVFFSSLDRSAGFSNVLQEIA